MGALSYESSARAKPREGRFGSFFTDAVYVSFRSDPALRTRANGRCVPGADASAIVSLSCSCDTQSTERTQYL